MSRLVAGVAALLLAGGAVAQSSPPLAERRAHVAQLHGVSRSDDYFWLRDIRFQESAFVRDPGTPSGVSEVELRD